MKHDKSKLKTKLEKWEAYYLSLGDYDYTSKEAFIEKSEAYNECDRLRRLIYDYNKG